MADLPVLFSRTSIDPTTLPNGEKRSVKTSNGFRPFEGGVGGIPVPLDAPTIAQHALKANDADVVKLTGSQTIAGAKAFTVIPTTSETPTANDHITNKAFVDGVASGLQTQLNNLSNAVAGGVKQTLPLDCSSNPNYPAGSAGSRWRVTVAGKVGGASGRTVQVGDTIECIEETLGGTEAAVGVTSATPKYFILNTDVDQASETVLGLGKLATKALAEGKADHTTIMTPLRTDNQMDVSAVRFDKVQTLTSAQKLQAQTNLGVEAAFSKGDIVLGTGVSATGTLTGRLVGTGNVTLSVNTTTLSSSFLPLTGFSGTSSQPLMTGSIVTTRGSSTQDRTMWEYRPNDASATTNNGVAKAFFRHASASNRYDFVTEDGGGDKIGTFSFLTGNMIFENSGDVDFNWRAGSAGKLNYRGSEVAVKTDISTAIASFTLKYVSDTWT